MQYSNAQLTRGLKHEMYFHGIVFSRQTMLARSMEMKLSQFVCFAVHVERAIDENLETGADVLKLCTFRVVLNADVQGRSIHNWNSSIKDNWRLALPHVAERILCFIQAVPIERPLESIISKR